VEGQVGDFLKHLAAKLKIVLLILWHQLQILFKKISIQRLLILQNADIFDSLNCLIICMQGAGVIVIDHAAEVAACYKNSFFGNAM